MRNNGNLLATPPVPDPTHDRNAWVHFRMGDYTAATILIDNDVVLPYSRLDRRLHESKIKLALTSVCANGSLGFVATRQWHVVHDPTLAKARLAGEDKAIGKLTLEAILP